MKKKGNIWSSSSKDIHLKEKGHPIDQERVIKICSKGTHIHRGVMVAATGIREDHIEVQRDRNNHQLDNLNAVILMLAKVHLKIRVNRTNTCWIIIANSNKNNQNQFKTNLILLLINNSNNVNPSRSKLHQETLNLTEIEKWKWKWMNLCNNKWEESIHSKKYLNRHQSNRKLILVRVFTSNNNEISKFKMNKYNWINKDKENLKWKKKEVAMTMKLKSKWGRRRLRWRSMLIKWAHRREKDWWRRRWIR